MHSSDYDLVVAAGIDMLRAALETGRKVSKQRDAVQPRDHLDAIELVFTALREPVAEVRLMQRQDVYGEMLGCNEGIVAHGVETDAPENQGRLE